MRRTGKFYYFTILSAVLGIISSVLIASWSQKSSPLHLWFDITFSGFGMSSLITTTLIVSRQSHLEHGNLTTGPTLQALIAAVGREDIAVATGST